MPSSTVLGLSPVPPPLKSIIPYLQRAEEVKSHDSIIAYWCAYYAAQVGITLRARDANSRNLLLELLGLLEHMKKDIGAHDAVDVEAASVAYIENYAFKVFAVADNEDRGGKATRATAKKFLAAANFLEVLKIFPTSEHIESNEEKIRYAKWKAADIAKALREGRKPVPGPAVPEVPEEIAVQGSPTTDVPMVINTTPPQSPPSPSKGASLTTFTRHIPTPLEYISEPGTHETPPPSANLGDWPPPESWSTIATPGTTQADGEFHEGWESRAERTDSPTSSRISDGTFTILSPGTQDSSLYRWDRAARPGEISPHGILDYDSPSSPSVAQRGVLPPPVGPREVGYVQTYEHVPPPAALQQPVDVPVNLTPAVIAKAQKHARFAISALDYEDHEQAKKELRTALAILGGR